MIWQVLPGLAFLLFGPLVAGVLIGVILDAWLSLRDLRREAAAAGDSCPQPASGSGRYCPPVSSRT